MQILEKINNILYNRQKSKIFKKSVTKLIFLLLIKIISYKKKSVTPPQKKISYKKNQTTAIHFTIPAISNLIVIITMFVFD